MLGTLDKVVGEFKKVRDFNEVSSAELKINQDLGALKSKADKEQDPTKLSEYQSQIDDVINKHSGGISDNLIRTEAQSKFNLRGYSAFSDITNTLRNKEIEIGKSNLLLSLDGYEKSYASNLGDVKRKEDMAGAKGVIELASKNGIIGQDDATKMTLEVGKNFDKAALLYDVQNLPDKVADLRKIGQYSHLSDSEFNAQLELANNFKEKNKKLEKEAIANYQINGGIEFVNQIATGAEIPLEDVYSNMESGRISPDLGKAYIKYLSSPQSVDVSEDKTGYAPYAEKVFAAGNQESINFAIRDALNGGADGRVNKDDLQYLVKFASMRAEKMKNKSFTDVIGDTFKNMASWFDFNSPEKKGEASADYVKTIVQNPEANPAVVATEVKAKFNNFYKAFTHIQPFVGRNVGDVVVLPNGKHVKFDGYDSDGEIQVTPIK